MVQVKLPENLNSVFSEKGFRPEEIALLERVSDNPALMLTSSQVKTRTEAARLAEKQQVKPRRK
jgi:hypothetical protein